jgi:23S rRNA G2445 N2-methylase RlmL
VTDTVATALDDLRLVGAGGTNKVMAGELSRLTRRAFDDVRLPEPRKAGTGALVYPFDARVAKLAALYHRTSARVLWDLVETRATRLEPMYADVLAVAEPQVKKFLWDGARLSVYAHGVQEFAAGERQVVGTVKNALIEAASRAGLRVTLDPETPNIVFSVRMDELANEERALRVSVDLAGRPMNQRGYRVERGAAPLREDLAAVLLMLARYDARSDILIDPFAGSGTIAIEAACMAKALPVWVPPRRALVADMPAFRDLPPSAADPRGLFGDTEPCIVASDVEPGSSEVIARAAQSAGVGSAIQTTTADFRDLLPSRVRELVASTRGARTHGLIIGNPPYGERIGDEARLEDLYADLGDYCWRFSGFRAAFLVAHRGFEQAFGHEPRIKKPLNNGPLPAYFYLYEVP